MFSMDNRRETDKNRRLLIGVGEDLCPGIFTYGVIPYFSITFKITVSSSSACMYYPLGDSFSIEMGHLLDKLVIFQSSGASVADRTQALVVINRMALSRG